MMPDPISDLLTRIRNAAHAKSRKVDIVPSTLKIGIVDILKKSGFIRNYKLYREDQTGVLRVYLKYADKNRPVVQGLKRVSRPGRRVYKGYSELTKVRAGMGVAILSTPKGLMTDEHARENKVGGEVLCTIW